ncbi:hypothetical protein SCHPADRAFT_895711 [Schizopora paradoxa]|uniref:Uncharacterized protein n=1 Tax=Schizopora paradoxa TaxID=27342 RepID=A0A0H2R2Z2_9AGAM|nr:hypothetical protein SCHPADRAFT_895711 [Schizopora paradoxa]
MASTTAFLNGLAVLENPREVKGKKKIYVFDAQMVITNPVSAEGDESQESCDGAEPITLVAALWYYNKYNIDFKSMTEPFLCEIRTTIARIDKGMNVHSTDDSTNVYYQAVGEIQQLIIVPFSVLDSPHHRRVCVDIIGTVTSRDPQQSTFTVQAQHYNPFAPTGKKGTISVTVIVPDSRRYQSGKPSPSEKSIVHVFGMLSALEYDDSNESSVKSLVVDLEEVNYISFPQNSLARQGSLTTPVKATGKPPGLFSFAKRGSPSVAGNASDSPLSAKSTGAKRPLQSNAVAGPSKKSRTNLGSSDSDDGTERGEGEGNVFGNSSTVSP